MRRQFRVQASAYIVRIAVVPASDALADIAADGSAYGVREVPINQNRFTHWLLVRDVFEYEEDEEMVEKDTIIFNGKEYKVNLIRKAGVTYVKTRDIADVIGLKVSSKGKVPVLESK